MGNDTCVRGSRGMLHREIFEKGCYLVHTERSEIINLKINNFRDNKSAITKIIRHILSSINPDVHVNKQKHLIKGVFGA